MANKEENASQSVLWSAVEKFSVQGINLVISLVIARLLLPVEFGLLAMLEIFISISQVFIDSGFSNALIQKQNRSDVDYSTVLYFNFVVALIIYIILFFISPLISDFYNEPILDVLTKWVGIGIIINSLSVVQRAKLSVEHNFKAQAVASLAGAIIGGIVGVVLAYTNHGVWALVAQSLSSQLIITLAIWILAKWRPRAVFSLNSFKSLFSFGSKLLASGLLQTIYTNLYTIVIGKFFSAAQLGYYGKANSLVSSPIITYSSLLQRVVYPYQCEIQNDLMKLRKSFLQYMKISVMLSLFISLLICSEAKSFVLLVLTEKWSESILYIQVLSIGYAFWHMSNISCQIVNVRGRSDLFLLAEVIKKIIAVLLLIITLPFGIKALCISIVAYYIIDNLLMVYFVNKVIGTTYKEVLGTLSYPIMIYISTLMVCITLSSIIENYFLNFLVIFLVATIFFCSLAYVFCKKDIYILMNYIKKLNYE